MATITFPSNPVLNQIYSYDGNTWIWDGSSWQLLTNGALNSVIIGNVVPETGAFTALTANTIVSNSLASGPITASTVNANTVSAGALEGTTLSLSGNVLSRLNVEGPVRATGFTTVGNIVSSGAITSSSNISAQYFIGDGSLLTNLPSGGTNYSNANVAAYLPTYTGNLQAGNVSILGNILGNSISILGRVVASGNITGGNILTSGVVCTTGNVVGAYLFGDARYLTNVPNSNYSNANVAAYLPTYSGNLNANSYTGNGAGLINITGANVVGTVANAQYATTAGTVVSVPAANIVGTVANATIAALAGAALTVPGSGVSGAVALADVANSALMADIALSVNAGDIIGTVANAAYATAAGSATTAVTVTATAQPNITSVGTLNSLTVTGNVTSGNVRSGTLTLTGTASVAGQVTAQRFVGDGSLLTGLPELNYSNANVAAYLPTYTGVVGAGSITTSGNVVGANIVASNQVSAASVSATGNIRGGNIATTGLISSSGNVVGRFLFGDGRYIANVPQTYTDANVANYLPGYTGDLSAGTLSVVGNTIVSNLYVYGDEFATQNIVAFGNIDAGNLRTTNAIITSGNVVASYYFGDGRFLTNLPSGSNYSNANVAAYLPTYTGNISGNVLSVSNITTGAISVAAGIVTNSANIVGNLVSGNISTGRVTAVSVTTAGNIAGSYIFGDGRFLTNVSANYSNANVAAFLPTYTGNLAGGNLTVSGNVAGSNINATANVVANGTLIANNASIAQTVAAGNITTTGMVSAIGNIAGNFFIGNGRLLTGLSSYGNSNVADFLTNYTGDMTADNISLAGDIVGQNIYMYGKVFATTILSAVGNVSGGNITTPGWVSAQGNVSARYYFGDGRFLSNIQSNYNNANVAAYLPTYTGNLNPGNVNSVGNVSAQYFVGNGSQLTGIQATEVGTLTTLSVTGNATVGNLNTTGNVTAGYFVGDGSQLTNLPATNYSNANVAAYLPTYTGNISANRISASGNVTGSYFIGNGSQLTGMYGNTNVAAYLPTYTGNLSVGNVSAQGNITGSYFVGNGSQLTGIQATVVGTLGNLSVTGNIVTANLNALGQISAVGNIVTPETLVTGNIIATGTAEVDGNLVASNISTTGQIISTGNVTVGAGNYFVGNGRFLTGVIASGLDANTLVGNTLSSNVLYSSLQQLGTLNTLSVSGLTTLTTANVAVLNASGNITTTAHVKANTLSASGNVTGDYILGNGSQLTGIVATDIGTIANLSVTGNVTVGGYYIGDGGLLSNITVTTTYGNSNVAAYLPTYTGNLAGGNISVSGNITGNGFRIRSINAANVVGTVANATYATTAGSTTSANLAAYVTANAQSNITSVGTLTSLSVSGNVQGGNLRTVGLISANGNIVTNGYFLGDAGLLSNLQINYSNANVGAYLTTYTGNLSANNANISGNLSVTGNIYGNLVGNIAANIVVPGANTEILYNDNGSAAANASFTYNNSTKTLFIDGLITASGNITGNYIFGNGRYLSGLPEAYSNANVAAYLPTYSGNLTAGNISVSGNINSATDIHATGEISAAGNVYGNYILGNASQLSNVPSVLTISNWNNGNVISNSISNVTALRFNANTGITVQDLGNAEALVSLGSSFKTWEVNGQANLVAVGEDVVKFVAGPGIVITTDPMAYPQEIAFAANVSNISNGTSNITIVNNGNIRTVVNGIDVVDVNADGLTVVGNVSGNYILGNGRYLSGLPEAYSNANVAAYLPTYTGNLTANIISASGNITAPYFIGNGSQLTGVVATDVGTLANLSVTGNVTAGGATFNGNVGITGNLSVTGNINYINVTDLVVGDPLIYFAANNTGNLLDIGWVGSYNDGMYQHTGLVRDHTDGVWKLFSNVAQEPTTVIDWANAQYDQFQAGQITSTATISAVGNVAGGNISTAGNVTGAYIIGDGSQLTNLPISTPIGNAINMGSNSQGQLVSNAVTLTANTTVTNGIALLNQVLGKLVPPSPPNFPNATSLSISSLSTYRMANFVQTDNTPGANKNVAGGTTVSSVRRAASYSTNTIANTGPGDSGTVVAVLNGASAGSVTLSSALTGNGTYSNLVITNNYDYHVANANITAGFWSVFSAQASGTVPSGWDEVYISDSATGNTNTPSWYYDASAPGTPGVGNLTITPTSTSLTYSSTVGHYNSSTQFTLGFTANRLSGDMYPTSDTFVTGTAGGSFAAPVSVTYATAGVTTPLARNLYVASGSQSVSTTSNIVTGFGASSTGPSVSVVNSYATGTGTFTTALSANVLYKTGTASTMEESNVVVGSSIGSGSGAAFRIVNPGSGDTPVYTGAEAAFNSQTSTLQTYDATIVAAVLKHDQTNYSTGYLPIGPDLSSGRSGAQYFTFKIQRSSVSKFDVKWTGTIAGLWVALPGSLTDSTSTLNGWLDMSISYGGAGAPGGNTGAGGNGSNGCALGGVAPLNSAQTNKSVTATFGTVSSTSATNNEIYIRIKLTSGQSVTALSLQTASN